MLPCQVVGRLQVAMSGQTAISNLLYSLMALLLYSFLVPYNRAVLWVAVIVVSMPVATVIPMREVKESGVLEQVLEVEVVRRDRAVLNIYAVIP
jgi:hypothetical protein